MNPLDVAGLTVTYPNGLRALDNVTLRIDEGRRVAVVGRSGSGKTTLVRAVLGLLPAGTTVEGRVRVAGTDILGAPERVLSGLRGRALGYVPQNPYTACDPLRTVGHHVAEAWAAHRETPPAGAVAANLTSVGIDSAGNRAQQHPHQWSGGMLQRATLVAAGVHDPQLTLADEPTSALDAALADDVLTLVADQCAALLLISHDLGLVGRHAEDVVVLSDGHVVERGTSEKVLTDPVSSTANELRDASTVIPGPPSGRAIASRRSTSSEPAAAQLERVSRRYRTADTETPALRDVSLSLNRGEMTGVVGPSGSGKSTLARLACGLERPDTGTLTINGQDHWARGRSTLRPGFVMPIFQDPAESLDRRWPLWRTITEPLRGRGQRHSRAARKRFATGALARVGLDGIDVDRLPGSLSVGQLQRVAVARAMQADPALLIADEPTASLDVIGAAAITDLLRDITDSGTAMLIVSHDEARLARYADRIVRITDGCLEEER